MKRLGRARGLHGAVPGVEHRPHRRVHAQAARAPARRAPGTLKLSRALALAVLVAVSVLVRLVVFVYVCLDMNMKSCTEHREGQGEDSEDAPVYRRVREG